MRRDRGTPLGRAAGWVLSYPVRFTLLMFAVVVVMTLCLGL